MGLCPGNCSGVFMCVETLKIIAKIAGAFYITMLVVMALLLIQASTMYSLAMAASSGRRASTWGLSQGNARRDPVPILPILVSRTFMRRPWASGIERAAFEAGIPASGPHMNISAFLGKTHGHTEYLAVLLAELGFYASPQACILPDTR